MYLKPFYRNEKFMENQSRELVAKVFDKISEKYDW